MSETPITPDDPEIPSERPPAELPEEDAPLPGLPEREPPAAD